MSESDAPSPGEAPRGPLSVYDFLMVMTDQLAAIAWQKLGLQPDPLTGQMSRDLGEAKVAIDLTTHIASFIEPRLDEEDKRQMRNLIRDLRMNFVEKSRESGS